MITETTVSSDEVTIEAPVEFVWRVLVDFDNYAQWNSFCPSCEAKLAIGSPIKMLIDLGFGPQEQVEYISVIEPCQAIAWAMENKPGDPVHAERSQYLKPLDETRCTYVTIDEFGGPAMSQMMDSMATGIEQGFNQCAYDLKAYCEKVYREEASGPA